MSLRYLLDTSIVSIPIAPSPNPHVIARLEERAAECAICAPVWHELNYGSARLPRGKRRVAVEAYLSDVVAVAFPILSYDAHAASRHASERARLDRAGRPAPFVDGQIAAIALANELVLVTANVKDFRRYAGLEVEDWTKSRRRR